VIEYDKGRCRGPCPGLSDEGGRISGCCRGRCPASRPRRPWPAVLHLLNRAYDPDRRHMAATGKSGSCWTSGCSAGAAFNGRGCISRGCWKTAARRRGRQPARPWPHPNPADTIELAIRAWKLWAIVELLP